jgi:hypothetical protein
VALEKRDQDGVAGGDEAPEEKHRHQGDEGGVSVGGGGQLRRVVTRF